MTPSKKNKIEKVLYIIAVTSIIADVLSTVLALKIWPDMFSEAFGLAHCMIQFMGLFQALLVLFCVRFSIVWLIHHSSLRYISRVALLALTGFTGLIVVCNNIFLILKVILYY